MKWEPLNLWCAGVLTGISIVLIRTNLTWGIIYAAIALMNYLAYFRQPKKDEVFR